MDIGGLAKEPGWLLSLDLPTEQPPHVPSYHSSPANAWRGGKRIICQPGGLGRRGGRHSGADLTAAAGHGVSWGGGRGGRVRGGRRTRLQQRDERGREREREREWEPGDQTTLAAAAGRSVRLTDGGGGRERALAAAAASTAAPHPPRREEGRKEEGTEAEGRSRSDGRSQCINNITSSLPTFLASSSVGPFSL